MQKSIQSAFDSLKRTRDQIETVWDVCSAYTLRDMFLPDERRKQYYEHPEDLVEGDDIGSFGMSHFISAVSRSVFPPNQPFFRYSAKTNSDLAKLPPYSRQRILTRMEQEATRKLYAKGLSSASYYLLGRLIGFGGVPYILPRDRSVEAKIEVGELNDVVVKRGYNGDILCIIWRDRTIAEFLPDAIKAQLNGQVPLDRGCWLFTMVERMDTGKYRLRQAVNNIEITLDDNFFPLIESEYQFASLATSRGRDYSLGVIFRLLRWLHAANVYRDANTDAAASGSLINWALSPSAPIRPEEFQERTQGQVFPLRDGELKPIITDIGQQYTLTAQAYQQVVQALQRAFLMYVPRDAERVTREEVRVVVQSLEDTHAGLYSQIAEALQRPLAHYGLYCVEGEDLTKWKDDVEVGVVAAQELLGRVTDKANLLNSLNELTVLNALPPATQQSLRVENIAESIFNYNNTNAEDFVKTPEEVQQEQQRLAEMQQGAAPAVRQQQSFSANDELLEELTRSSLL